MKEKPEKCQLSLTMKEKQEKCQSIIAHHERKAAEMIVNELHRGMKMNAHTTC